MENKNHNDLLQSIISDLSTIERTIINKQINNLNNKIWQILFHNFHYLLLVIFIGGFLYFSVPLLEYNDYLPINIWFWGWLGTGIGLYKYVNYISLRIIKLPKEIKVQISNLIKKHQKLLKSIYGLSDLDEINSKCELLLSLIKETTHILKTNKIRLLKIIAQKELKFSLIILNDIRNDLFRQLTKEKLKLENAKSEVEKNIQGNTELNQVSELQKIRLDKQIEQFEELQRVLVKV